MLIPRTRQAKGLVPSGQLQGAATGVLGQGHGQRLDQDAIDVIFRLLFGQAQRIDLNTIAEAAGLIVGNAIALLQELIPKLSEGAHLAKLGHKPDPGIDEEADARDHDGKVRLGHLTPGLDRIQHRDGGGQRIGQFLLGRRTGLLQMVGTDVGRVPFGRLDIGPSHHIADHPHRGGGRIDIGPARQIFLHQVVLGRALQGLRRDALLLRQPDIERQEPRRRRINGHGGVHAIKRDLIEQGAHVAHMADRHPNLTDLTARQNMVWIIAGLGRQIEGHRQACLTLGQIGAVEGVGLVRRRVASIGADDPRGVWRMLERLGGHVRSS